MKIAILVTEKSVLSSGSIEFYGKPPFDALPAQADQLFDWLDQSGNGTILVAALSSLLSISPVEASTLIKEARPLEPVPHRPACGTARVGTTRRRADARRFCQADTSRIIQEVRVQAPPSRLCLPWPMWLLFLV